MINALAMSYFDISKHIEKIYTFKVSSATLIAVNEKNYSKSKTMATLPISTSLFFVWLDAIYYKVREQGCIH